MGMAGLNLVNFDQVIRRLRFNLESAKSAVEFGVCPESDLETLETYIQKLKDDIRKLKVAEEVAQKKTLADEDVKRVMGITCFANLGYCCGLDKACVWRDSCRQALGINDETYTEIKEAIIWQMLEQTNKAGPARLFCDEEAKDRQLSKRREEE